MRQSKLAINELREAVVRMPADKLSAMRAAALARLGEDKLPSTRHEDWKYTDLRPAIEISNRWLAEGASNSHPELSAALIARIKASIDANWLLIVNGVIDTSDFDADTGIELQRFSDTSAPQKLDTPLSLLNAALLTDGLRLTVHAATEKPLGLLVFDASDSSLTVTQANVQIEVAAGCDAEIIEYQASGGSHDSYANSVIRLELGEGAKARYVRIQDRQREHMQTARLDVTPGNGSELEMAGYDLGGRLIRNDVVIDLQHPNAQVSFNGLYLAGDGQHIDNHTRVDHRVGPATSFQEYRGILNGRCRCVWNGKAVVHKGADGTDANQANHNLLLSEFAEIDAKPELEIYADEVKCSHGTTVGQLDKNALYYLRTRGLDRLTAKHLLTRAFASDLVRRAPVAAAYDAIAALVDARLAELTESDAE